MKSLALLFKLSLRNVLRNRRRSFYALATIAMGAMGLILFTGFNRGLMNQYRDTTIRARWGHGQVYIRNYYGKAHTRPWEKWIEKPELLMERLQLLPGVEGLFPRLTLHAMLVAGEQAVTGQGEGIDGLAEAGFFNQLNYVEGEDFTDRLNGIVIGKGLAYFRTRYLAL